MSAPTSASSPSAFGIAPPPATAVRLPPLPRPGDGGDGLSPSQRRLMVVAILLAHGAGVWALLQVQRVQDAVREAAPMFVNLIAPPATSAPPPEPTPPPPTRQPIQKKPTPAPVITAAPSPAPAAFVVAEQPVEPPLPTPPAPLALVEAPPAPPVPAAPPPPKMISASSIQYLVPPELDYPRLSRRNGESGTVIVRALADEAGLPHQVQLERSSGFVRLDEAALSAVRKTRFKPYTENGKAVAGWVRMPFPFELEK